MPQDHHRQASRQNTPARARAAALVTESWGGRAGAVDDWVSGGRAQAGSDAGEDQESGLSGHREWISREEEIPVLSGNAWDPGVLPGGEGGDLIETGTWTNSHKGSR